MDRRSLLRGGAAAACGMLTGNPGNASSSDNITLDSRIRSTVERRLAAIKLGLESANDMRPRYGSVVDPTLIFSKGMRHNSLLQTDRRSLESLYRAIDENDFAAVERIYSADVPLANPIACNAFSESGLEAVQIDVRPPPAPLSPEFEWEADELWWAALCRDIPFREYKTHSVVQAAANRLMTSTGGNNVDYIFQPLDRPPFAGPYVSQFILKRSDLGGVQQSLRGIFTASSSDSMASFPEFLSVQNGNRPSAKPPSDGSVSVPISGRHLANVVHRDFPAQYFMYAAQGLLAMGPASLNRKHPYANSHRQAGFVSFGLPHCFALLNRVSCMALQAAWYYKWRVYRRIRPEEYFGYFHLAKTGQLDIKINTSSLGAELARRQNGSNGTYLLPQVYPEGCPVHPSYPAGHAAVAGACSIILKCFFNSECSFAMPVEPNTTGTDVDAYKGELTVGDEIDKLVWNLSFGRTFAGVHWRSDSVAGIKLGEQIAGAVLRESKLFSAETQETMTLIRFQGDVLRV